jgi:hypothetical protein
MVWKYFPPICMMSPHFDVSFDVEFVVVVIDDDDVIFIALEIISKKLLPRPI